MHPLVDPSRSSYREKLLEHLFIGDLLRCLWTHNVCDAELLRAEVDGGGYDLVVECRGVIRHIQLKSSHRDGKAADQKVNARLADKPSGCVVWTLFESDELKLGPFLWLGNAPGQPLTTLKDLPIARHTKGNAKGLKAERPNIRVVKKSQFERVQNMRELSIKLFGDGALERT